MCLLHEICHSFLSLSYMSTDPSKATSPQSVLGRFLFPQNRSLAAYVVFLVFQ